MRCVYLLLLSIASSSIAVMPISRPILRRQCIYSIRSINQICLLKNDEIMLRRHSLIPLLLAKSSTVSTSSPTTPFTISAPLTHTIDVKKSQFIAHIYPCDSIDYALKILDKIKDDKASHNCWAFRTASYERCSDDGEPAGTAGRPILNAIQAESLVNVMVIVIRYFGGIKLGTGGLMRAYGQAARDALKLSSRLEVIQTKRVKLTTLSMNVGQVYQTLQSMMGRCKDIQMSEGSYTTMNEPSFQQLCESNSLDMAPQSCDDQSIEVFTIEVSIPLSLIEELASTVKDATRGKSAVEMIQT